MSKETKCCLGCTDREIGCHEWCERHKRRKAIDEARKARQRESYDIDAYTNNRVATNLDFAAKARRDAAGRSKLSGKRK